jgi:hypothetical protein
LQAKSRAALRFTRVVTSAPQALAVQITIAAATQILRIVSTVSRSRRAGDRPEMVQVLAVAPSSGYE